MVIGTRNIGGHYRAPAPTPPYIIAEIGVNHDGSADRALELVDAAAWAGADAVKLQLFRADLLMSRAARLAEYQRAAGEADPIDMLRRLELSFDEMERIGARAHENGLHAIVSVFSVELVPEAERLPWDAYKTASPDIIHKPLLDALAATRRPLIVSTGAANVDEIGRSLMWLGEARTRLALLQCVSCYPTRAEEANIAAMSDLFRIHGIVGYSDHTIEEDTGAVAARQGATLLEKHLTYDRAAHGPDHAASLDPKGLKRYCKFVRGTDPQFPEFPRIPLSPDWDCRFGDGHKRVLSCEQDVRIASRQSIIVRRNLNAGGRIERTDLTFKRPGTGFPPFMLDEVVGRKLARDVEADMPLTQEDLV